jgi:uncharacterized protein involved in exopolysaccharide biosynthesis/Mrp family chromosome partitioning ATPase
MDWRAHLSAPQLNWTSEEKENLMQRPHIEMPPGFKVMDIFYVLFRRKWLIFTFLVLGAAASFVLYVLQKPLYVSEAKLLVRYVVEAKSVESGIGTQVNRPDYGGDMILNSELEILTSLDLCEEVATLVGPEKISGGGGSNVMIAAVALYKGLTVENPRRSNIIKVRFVHRDPAVCQTVLRQLIESYFRRHKEVHRAGGSYDEVLSKQALDLDARIRTDEEELRKLKAQAGVISVEDSKKALTDQLSRLQQDIFDAEAQLAECNAMLKQNQTNKTEAKPVENGVPKDKVSEYKSLLTRIDSLRARELALADQYRDDYEPLKLARRQLAEHEQKRKAIETEFPTISDLVGGLVLQSNPGTGEPRMDPLRASSLETKIRVLTNHLAMVRGNIANLDKLETQIADVERRLKLNQQNYMHIAAGLEAAKFDDALSEGKLSNIQQVQTPSPAALNVSQRLKMMAGAFFGIFAFGISLAFSYELLIDRSVRRPDQFEQKFKMPLFLSIPRLGLNGHAKKLPLPRDPKAPAQALQRDEQLRETWAPDHPLRPFIDGLRDRALIHFGGDPHKPKLIGVTSCSQGSGVTSIAAGLAGALSETGDGNVLLLNLNFDSQAVHPFFHGELSCGLTDALEVEKRDSGKVLNNLYVATAGNPADPETQNLSKQLARVVPKLRVSDYDYIVFDLPPTTPITPTARLSGMMDLVVLVVEAEKDSQESVKQASQLLARAKAPVSAVLNKVKNPLPKWLHGGPEVVS